MSQPYGPMPQPAWQPPPAPPRPPRPRTVDIACALLTVLVVSGIVGTIVTLASQDEVRRELERRNSSLSDAQIEQAAHIGIVVGVVVGFGLSLFYLFLAYKMMRGRNWARITTWVFMGLASFALVTAFAFAEPAFARALGVFNSLCAISIIVLLARRPSNDYFRKPPQYGYGYGYAYYYPPPAR